MYLQTRYEHWRKGIKLEILQRK
ncbi:BnaCnng37350D [Brassica napus]|uniref:BnaCnng37350D protein n=1 Tax=Brassica napus TaxID=3708 RepID=A0A078J4I3_BRANA|nr:BnaCnng37350D [Brassica napus]